jgi:phenylalanyl-tRNA synthetase beta chain
MRISFDWLKDFVDISASAEEVAEKLTNVGLEIEGMESVGADTLLEVNVTPNRPDCLSVLGIAREVAAAFGLSLKLPDSDIGETAHGGGIDVEILNPELCNRYTGRLIEGITVGETPAWIRDRLEKCGLRALNNNIVDITNYVLLEFGHPLHAFDADRLRDGKIRIGKAGGNRKITTLDGVKRKLPEEALLIWDGRDPVAVAGIMGGEESSVTGASKNVFLESAYFEPFSIRRTSKQLGLRSESSYRFERGTDIEFLVKALDRAALLMKETGGGTIHEMVDAYPVPYEAGKVRAGCARINSLLGTSIEKDEMMRILAGIGLDPEDAGEDFFLVHPPAYRRDIRTYVDILEEVARLHGYLNIPVKVPRTNLPEGRLDRKGINIGRMREAFRKAGFSEVINYSFMNPADLDLISLPENDPRRKHVRVMNPLKQEESLMRTTLVPSLIHNFVYNLSRGIRDIRFFEIAKIFIDAGYQLPNEELRLSGIFYRENQPSLWRDEAPSFFTGKGVIECLFDEMKIPGVSFVPSPEAFLHSGKSADILLGGKRIGFSGELGPEIAERLGLKINKPEIIVFEMDLDVILSAVPGRLTYCGIPRYPSIDRDVAVVVDDNITSEEVFGYIKEYRSKWIEGAELFDFYKGKNIPGDKKSLAFRITYRSDERTLTDNEVEPVHKGLVDYILMKTAGALRGV